METDKPCSRIMCFEPAGVRDNIIHVSKQNEKTGIERWKTKKITERVARIHRQCETAQIDLSSRRALSNRVRRDSNSCRFATMSFDGCNRALHSSIASSPVIGSFAVRSRESASSSASTSDWSRIIGTLSVYRCMATVKRYSLSVVQV